MAERDAHRARKRPSKAPAPGTAPAEPPAAIELTPVQSAERIAALEAEMDRLRGELAVARERIATLEAARDQALDRIAWVIDSLHNWLDD